MVDSRTVHFPLPIDYDVDVIFSGVTSSEVTENTGAFPGVRAKTFGDRNVMLNGSITLRPSEFFFSLTVISDILQNIFSQIFVGQRKMKDFIPVRYRGFPTWRALLILRRVSKHNALFIGLQHSYRSAQVQHADVQTLSSLLFVCLSVSLSLCLCLSVRLSVCLSVCLSTVGVRV